jgi:hypothetical protein
LLSCNVKKSKTTALCIYEKNRDNFFVLWYRELNYMYKNIIYAVKIFCQSISLYVKKKSNIHCLIYYFCSTEGMGYMFGPHNIEIQTQSQVCVIWIFYTIW